MWNPWNQKNSEIFGETGMFADCDEVRLLFPVRKIQRIFCSATGMEYLPERDWNFNPETQQIIRPENSRIPRLSDEDLHPAGPFYPNPGARAIQGGLDGRPLLFDNRNFFAEHQFAVDYIAEEIDFPLEEILSPLSGRLPRFRAKLSRRGGAIRISWLGDSISEGYNASGYHKFSPFQPPFAELAARHLGERFSLCVELRNHSLSGARSEYPLTCVKKWSDDCPDLQVIAFGMNDFAVSDEAEEYLANIQKTVQIAQLASPETEFLLIASMSGNPEWSNTPLKKADEFSRALRQLAAEAGKHVAFADLFSLWQRLLKRKTFMDLTGNGVNHPNDFGHRVFALGVNFILEKEA